MATPGTPLTPDPDVCYRALCSHDARFDGRFFVGVTTTRIYCRPICPARTPLRRNCRFFLTAAAAEQSGFRACLRCRPEIAPELPAWRGSMNTVSRAMARIAEGALDLPHASVGLLAAKLGVGERQLRRLFDQHIGASPLAVAQTRRVLFAKQLLHDTQLPMASVALASGFGSIRRFNDTFRTLYRRPPSQLRRRGVAASAVAPVQLRLPYRPPFDWPALLAFFAARAIPGVEAIEDGVYRRTVCVGEDIACIAVTHDARRAALQVEIAGEHVRVLPVIAARLRCVFDLHADTAAIAAQLATDAALAPLLGARPGLRCPGGWDTFEVAVRAVLGQQISIVAARQLAGKLVQLCGTPLPGARTHLTRAFPTAKQVAAADLRSIGMPAARREALAALARAILSRPSLFEPADSLEESVTQLRTIPGIGEWTAQYIALRGLHHPDAFPASDRGLLRGARQVLGRELSPAQLLARAESWRPWRGYAAQHLWAAAAALPPERSSTLPRRTSVAAHPPSEFIAAIAPAEGAA